MAHYSIPEPDPDPEESDSSGEVRSGRISGYGDASEPVDFEADLAELASKFASEECGHLSAELSADLALQVVLNEIVEQACTGTGAGGAAIILEREEEWVCRASAGTSAPELGARLGSDSGLIAQCIKTGRVQRCNDAITDLRVDIAACRALGVRSLIAMPLIQDENLVGVFAAFSPRASAFGESEEQMLDALARCVIGTIAQAADPEANLARPREPQIQMEEVEQGREGDEAGAVLAMEDEILAVPARDETQALAQAEFGEAERGEIDKSELILADSVPEAHPSQSSLPGADGEKAAARHKVLPGRGMNVVTWALAAAVLAIAAFVITISSERLLGTKASAAHRAPIVASGQQHSDARSGPGAEPAGERSLPPATEPSVVKSVQDGTQGAGAVKDSARPHPASPPTGSLAVFENGREVFRMPTAEMRPETGNADTAATSVKRASIYELAPKDAEKNVIQRVEPDYPEAAREQQIQGVVVLEVTAGPDGTVQNVTPVSGPAQLVDSAVAAVKQWQFRPHLENGKPVQMATRVTLNFRLP
jgi:TonB family protein